MFLSHHRNPHQGGRPTRAVLFETGPDTCFAIDAEALHREPRLLGVFGPSYALWLRSLDGFACLLAIASVMAAIAVGWWIAIWGLGLCTWMVSANRRMAGRIARAAARRSPDNFRILHEMGCLWLVQPQR